MGAQPLDNNYKPIAQNLYDPTGVQFVSPLAGTVKTGSDNTSYAPTVHQISTNNTGLPVNTPVIVQKANAVSTGNVASLAKTFGSNNTAGNTIIAVCGNGNNGTLSVTDTLGNTYTSAVSKANSTTFEAAIFFAVGITSGANTVTVANAGTAASMALEIYEVSGPLALVYVSVAGATTVNPQLNVNFPYPLAASATNTTIVASAPSLGSGNLHACTNAYGFQI